MLRWQLRTTIFIHKLVPPRLQTAVYVLTRLTLSERGGLSYLWRLYRLLARLA
jgi:hypothetical protein